MCAAATTEILSVDRAGEGVLRECLALFSRFYANVTEEKFFADFLDKKWVILLKEGGVVIGFSTQTFFLADGRVFLYSGDTVVAPEYWRKRRLSGAFCHLMTHLLERFPDKKCYWFLTSKGFRTFRYLPVFFKSFYPDFAENPKLKHLLDAVAMEKYPDRYDVDTGIIHPAPEDNVLREEMRKRSVARDNDRYIQFFFSKNPKFGDGDELACITEINPDNFKKTIFRVLESTKVDWNVTE